jgi:hypothetical protein
MCFTASADAVRSQSVQLHKGWNAVFIEVDPVHPGPAEVFQGTSVTIAAAFTGNEKAVQFVQNPSTNSLTRQNGWEVWYAPERPDGFLSSLFQINGNKAYLLFAESDCELSLTGRALLNTVAWKPNSFTLAGFGVDSVSPPTFEQFFRSSPAHQPYRIYRLVNGVWARVDNAQTAQMRAGEACWIYCQGSSDYQGPLTVQPETGSAVVLRGGSSAGLLLKNRTADPLGVRVQNISPGTAPALAYVLRAATATNVISTTFDLPADYAPPVFEANESRGFWLMARAEGMTSPAQDCLLKITTDIGTVNWLPISVSRTSL